MLMLDEDRRRDTRIAVERPCKVFDPRTGKYYPGTVRDISAGGMLIILGFKLDLPAGHILHVGVAQKRRQMLLCTSEMLRMRVARSAGTPSGELMVGLEMIDHVPASDSLRRQAA